ncbi:hypothetical protein I3760_15G061300 [Carya illinoinensis]|nr:hypothetical protein I3760_15G061300 [Carya illinoinensis]KAG2666462.1 hypothetical protein I3760_15G061300 [Carya illinoinensis]
MAQTLVCNATQPADDSIKKDHQIELKELIINIPPEPKEPPRWPDCCIYRVPKRLRELKKEAYTPRLVSIGPFHCMIKDQFKDMEQQKVRYFWSFCKRTGKSSKDLACIIERDENKIRQCYSENFDGILPEEFVTMILLDAIFILELFLRKSDGKTHEKDYILSQPCMERGIQLDLLLLENQLPFFVLEQLYQNGEPNTEKPTVLDLSNGFFGDLRTRNWQPNQPKCENHVKQCFTDLVGCGCPRQENQKASSPDTKPKPKHFTDLVRHFFCPTSKPEPEPEHGMCTDCYRPNQEQEDENKKPEPKHCVCSECFRPNQEQEDAITVQRNKHLHGTATKLGEAGLKFTRPDSKRDLLEIRFRENVCLERFPCFNLSWLLSCLPCLKSTCLVHVQRFLEVPPLLLDDKTESLFRNLMALEQCHYPSETYFCDYIVLLDDLITTKEDVRLLVEKKIIVNELGSSTAVTDLVNNLALEIEESGTHYAELCEKLNTYYESNWNRLVGTLTGVYFPDIFKGSATVVGIIVLVLTLWNFHRLLRLSAANIGKY